VITELNGKELHQLTKEELIEADKEIKLAFLKTSHKNGLQQFRVGDNVRVEKRNWSAEGVIEDIGSKTATVNIGDQTILATAKMITKV
jgi:putative ribosome biogenesis GTPase RsgA